MLVGGRESGHARQSLAPRRLAWAGQRYDYRMIEFEWQKKGKRAEAAKLLRELADSLDGDGTVELEHDGWELKLPVANDLELGVEIEVDGDDTELEIELKWTQKRSGSRSESAAS